MRLSYSMKPLTKLILFVGCAIVFWMCSWFFYITPTDDAMYFPAFATVVFFIAFITGVVVFVIAWQAVGWVLARLPISKK